MLTTRGWTAVRFGTTAVILALVLRLVAVLIDAFTSHSPFDLGSTRRWIVATQLMGVTPPLLMVLAALALRCIPTGGASRLRGPLVVLLALVAVGNAVVAIGSFFQGWADSLGQHELTYRADALMQLGFAVAVAFILMGPSNGSLLRNDV